MTRAETLDVLYLEGDKCSPKYIAGALTASGFAVETVTTAHRTRIRPARAIILSDVPASGLTSPAMVELAELVHEGAGLLVVGGWKSFGAGGYAGSPLADALPVTLVDGDDRINVPSGAWLQAKRPDELTRALPFDEPPVITGYNRFKPRGNARVIIEAYSGWHEQLTVPILVTGDYGQGRVAAWATDLAPHWSGGLTDWGGDPQHVGEGEELGWAYIELLQRVVAWVAQPTHRAREPTAREDPV